MLDRFNLYITLVVASTILPHCMATSAKISDEPLRQWHVKVVNRMSRGESLKIHCKSSEDDIGFHTLYPGQEFSWTFKINIWTTTSFFCYMWHGPNDTYTAAFQVFRASDPAFEMMLCEEKPNQGRWCTWEARDDAVYASTGNLRHFWERSKKGGAISPVMAPVAL